MTFPPFSRRLGLMFRWLFVCLLAAGFSPSLYALSVRVDAAGGAPRIVVDGQPVRARMFFGAPGSAPLPIDTEWKEVQFEFTSAFNASNGTMHFRFGQEPGEVFLDDIRVSDVDAGSQIIENAGFEGGLESFSKEWTSWPTGAANTVGTIAVQPGVGHNGSSGLHVTLKAPVTGEWPDFHIYHKANLEFVAGRRYKVAFRVRASAARKLTVGFYSPGKSFLWLGGPQDSFTRQIKLAASVGVNFVSCPMPEIWPKPGEAPNWAAVDTALERVLAANPRALIIPRIGMDPPKWWSEAHLEDVMQWEDGRRAKGVPASPRYRHDAAEQLAAFVSHVEEKFGEHVAGYHPTGQNTGEWFYEDTWKHALSGFSPADAAAWRQWLKERYKTDDALRRAWRNPAAALETAAVPTAAERHAAPSGIFRDPTPGGNASSGKELELIDWNEFQQIAMADCVRELAHAARTASHGKKLVLFFYGYVFEFAGVSTGPSVAGHYALRRVLDCPDIDMLCSPISYADRGPDGSAPSMSAPESVALAGKMWLNEDDTHTYLATGTPPGWDQHVNTLEETNKELVRNVAQEAMRNFATWWMDLGATGWFDDPGMWREMARLKAIDQEFLKTPTPFRPEVAAVIDERSMWRVAEGGAVVARPAVFEARRALGRMGAPYGQYLLDDAVAGRVSAKMYVFLNAWNLPEEERERLITATRGAMRVWCYAPAYFQGESSSSRAGAGALSIHSPPSSSAERLTGFKLRTVSPGLAWATPTEAGRKLGLEKAFGVEKAIKPLLAVVDATPEEILATYPDGSTAIALRRASSGPSLFVGVPGLTPELLRLVAREGGVHLYSETDCNIYANGNFAALHASEDSDIHLSFRQPGEIRDALSGEAAGRGQTLDLTVKKGDTRVFKIEPFSGR